MHFAVKDYEEMLGAAVAAAPVPGAELFALLDRLTAPTYVTDAAGVVTFFNQACVEFAGRTPVTGVDRWCVTWKLYTSGGTELPHHACPMALAIQRKQAIRGAQAVAERPDGSRVEFLAHPTPLFDEAGETVGAVNMLVDITARKQAAHLEAQALRCLRLAASVDDARATSTLKAMAAEYRTQARALRRPN
jgi:PAS domain S-box-containing protein